MKPSGQKYPKKQSLKSTRFHLPYNPENVAIAKELRKNMTPAEKKLWLGYLRDLPVRVLRQRPIDHYIVDFYCASLKLVIEVDGDSHYTDESKVKDFERTKALEGYGLTLIRFTNKEVLENFEGVCAVLMERIPPNPP